jgi:hypothetical protein
MPVSCEKTASCAVADLPSLEAWAKARRNIKLTVVKVGKLALEFCGRSCASNALLSILLERLGPQNFRLSVSVHLIIQSQVYSPFRYLPSWLAGTRYVAIDAVDLFFSPSRCKTVPVLSLFARRITTSLFLGFRRFFSIIHLQLCSHSNRVC